MSATLETTQRPEDRFVAAFEMQDGHTLNGSNAVVQGLRREAIRQLARLGFPTRKSEAWKYTNLDRLLRADYRLMLRPEPVTLSAADVEPLLVPDLDAHLIVLVNGRWVPELSVLDGLPDGVVVTSFARASETHAEVLNRHFGRYADAGREAFTALNTAFTQDGLFVYVPKSRVIVKPLQVVSVASVDAPALLQPRNLLVFEENAQARIVESHHSRGRGASWTNAVTEVFVAQHAVVEHFVLQQESAGASRIQTTNVYQQAQSVFTTATVTFGGAVVRNNLSVLPDGEHCETHLYGLFLGRGDMHVDNHTFVDHAQPACQSNELYKGILDDRSTGVFNGKVYVRRDAQQTNAYQSNKSVVLTEQARMFSKPELEIYADDVKCSHGATTGQLDQDALFYLMARGIPERRARAMLLLAFAHDVVERIALSPLRAYLDHVVEERYHD